MRTARTITAARYVWLIERLGLNQSSAARLLGISDRQSRRFVAGDARVDRSIAMLFELMVELGITPEEASGRIQRQKRN
jgi:hypothetical protein